MRLFNGSSGAKEVFQPMGDPVTLYVCGVTPYDTTHIGHARTYLIFDLLQRYLVSRGMRVRYVQNVTDVDDPLFARARDLRIDYRQLARQCVDTFLADLDSLNVLKPTVHPWASQEIPAIIDGIRILADRGMAYARGGSVYFRATRFPRYGVMSGLDRSGMLAAHRESGETPDDPNKADPLDFRLWQPAQPDEPVWDSPWGPGRPGWHIECSTMVNRYLGSTIDIHGGGADLIFPHHCSEIAQSESVTGESPFARFWVHVGLVWMDGEKMSKSLGNMAFVRDLVPLYGGNALRYYLFRDHYRERFHYTDDSLAAAAEEWRFIQEASAGPTKGPGSAEGQALAAGALDALDDDLDAPQALRGISRLATLVRDGGPPRDRVALRSLLEVMGFRVDGAEPPRP